MTTGPPPRAFPPRLTEAEVNRIREDAAWLARWAGVDFARTDIHLRLTWEAEDALQARPAPRKAPNPVRPLGATGERDGSR